MESIFELAVRKGVSMVLLTPRYNGGIKYELHCSALEDGGYPVYMSEKTVGELETKFREWLNGRKDYPVLVPGEIKPGKYSHLITKVIAKEK